MSQAMSNNEQLALLNLANVLSPKVQQIALPYVFKHGFFERQMEDWLKIGLLKIDATRLCNRENLPKFELELEKLLAMNVAVVARNQVDALNYAVYPYTLDSSDQLPPILFVRGDTNLIGQNSLGIVGTRKPSAYGREITESIARRAAQNNIATVSGAALGIDTVAHLASLAANGKTIAVLGSGMFHVYPKNAGSMLDRICENGLVISQFPPNKRPDRSTFPIRNKIIAALSTNVLVIEGLKKSGARYTADYTKKMGKRLFALPGDISRPQSQLPNDLIASGADILKDIDDLFLSQTSKNHQKQGEIEFKATKSYQKVLAIKTLDELEIKVMEFIDNGASQIDQLLRAEIASPGELNASLLKLELEGLLVQEMGRRYSLTGLAHENSDLWKRKG